MLFLHIQFKNRQLGQNDEIVKLKILKNMFYLVLGASCQILQCPHPHFLSRLDQILL